MRSTGHRNQSDAADAADAAGAADEPAADSSAPGPAADGSAADGSRAARSRSSLSAAASGAAATRDCRNGRVSSPGLGLDIGELVREYEIRESLACGGFGAVYRAEHQIIGRQVAIKVLHADLVQSDEAVERFMREARAVSTLDQPNIVAMYDLGTLADGRPYQIMELVPGEDLGKLLARCGRLSPERAFAVLDPLCLALHAAHEHGIVHRDVKASNVMVDTATEPWGVKLLDFGIAKLLTPPADCWRTMPGRPSPELSARARAHPRPGGAWETSDGSVLGTPHAMAPEQIRGEPVDHRADIYALGVMLFQILTGRPPFLQTRAQQVYEQHLSAEPPAPSWLAPVAPAFDALVLRAMAKDPLERFSTAAQLRVSLSAAVRGLV
ncbi:serine/threonine-protein kinase [Haliangium ochraceum]|uniref:Serine/threonine protein kinase n=1 Tax=Haliangium ochraceum (strain DSM 14365 / JCM 11303 / SMP-2) TaxID=502025 RepID=D0LLZ5_HALO1|nr:serine/threonine-protein kinase [Haliangium ochraceum]ACY15173.1 serine/threonine protein kinase [Haliangium ochraceum DSM 14365]